MDNDNYKNDPDLYHRGIDQMIDAVVAIPADDRAGAVHYALQLITPGMHTQDKIMMLEQVALQPAPLRADYVRDRLAGIHHPEPAQGINIHEGDRDDRVRAAVQLLYQGQGDLPQVTINQAADAFVAYLNDSPVNDTDKQLAREALLTPIRDDEQFGPLIEQENFILSGLEVSGRELIGRLWIFASQLDDPDQTNVKRAMISALKDSYDIWGRVCNEGKTQRLVLAVLQGRLEGVNIEGAIIQNQVSKAQAMQMFFQVEAHRLIDTKTNLIQAANQFCDENPGVNRQEFFEDINIYATEQEMAEQ